MVREVKLYEVPKIIECARVLDDSILEDYNESVMSKYYNNKTARKNLLKFGSSNGELTGSNPFMLIHLQESGLLKGERLLTRPDLEKALNFGLNLSRNYVDFGVALRGNEDSYKDNKILASHLVSQFNDRKINFNNPGLIPFSVLTQKEDSNSIYGLTLSLKDDVSNDYSLFSLDGFKWDRTATKDGIARAYRSRNGSWISSYNDFAFSFRDGRVVVIKSEINPNYK